METFFSLFCFMLGMCVIVGCIAGSVALIASVSVAGGIVALILTLVVLLPGFIALMIEFGG